MILHHKIFGKGKVVLILHGLFGMLDNWQRFAKALSETHQVILVDQRNHGKSFRSDEFSYDLLAEDVRELLCTLEISHIHLIGHSMGGKTAMTFCERYPEMVKSAVVVDIAPKAYVGNHDAIFKAVLSVDVSSANSRREIDDYLARTIHDQVVRLFLMKNLKRDKDGSYLWKANFPVLYRNYDDIMNSDLRGPVETKILFVKAELSDYILPEDEVLIKSTFTNSSLTMIPGAGHWVHADRPEELLEQVLGFLLEDE